MLNAGTKRVLRAALRARDGDDCFYCLRPLGADDTLEHIERWGDGGSNHPDNLALAHAACNFETRELSVDEKMLRRGDALLARLSATERAKSERAAA